MCLDELITQILHIKDTSSIRHHLEAVRRLIKEEPSVQLTTKPANIGSAVKTGRKTSNLSVHQRNLFFGDRGLGPLSIEPVQALGGVFNCISFFDKENVTNFCLTYRQSVSDLLPLANATRADLIEVHQALIPALISNSKNAVVFSKQGLRPLPKQLQMRSTPQFGRIPITKDGSASLTAPDYPITRVQPLYWLPCIPWQRRLIVGSINHKSMSWFYSSEPRLLAIGDMQKIISCAVSHE